MEDSLHRFTRIKYWEIAEVAFQLIDCHLHIHHMDSSQQKRQVDNIIATIA